MKLIFATQNRHKLNEVSAILGKDIELVSLPDLDFHDELPETHATLEENAEEKSRFVYDRFKSNCFAEDTVLEVKALLGAPGVYSARYAGEGKNSDDNINLLLHQLGGEKNRRARFRTVISLILEGKNHFFEGITEGTISAARCGEGGFGYDPVFIPEGHVLSYAEMPPELKNKISHRRKAFEKMNAFLHEAGKIR
ncbi:MAG: RdgB/HAM1 family non-canonical purine NTP pyrophosphatase [Chitinophagales bacterium]|nr:RdgB/HAM1 family non-canonical purine NTP pyrophosphatase [Chitinophagales bacterium]